MNDVTYIAAFPKSGITFLNYMLFHALFDAPENAHLIDSEYIYDIHESLNRIPVAGTTPRYVKTHFAFGPSMPLRERASRAIQLVRDPIDVMMSVWDFKHLMDEDGLLEALPHEHAAKFADFVKDWLSSGGLVYPWAGSWLNNVV